jgi:excisionase family DNA binding protein
VTDQGSHNRGAHPNRQRGDERSGEERSDALLTIEEVCAALRCKRTKVFEYLAAGQLERRRFGRSTCVTRASVEMLIAEGLVLEAPARRRRRVPRKKLAAAVLAIPLGSGSSG